MSTGTLILTIDQGTTSSRAILFDESGVPLSKAQTELTSLFPRPGWVEQDPIEIRDTSIGVALSALDSAGVSASDLSAVGITNQRETTILWESDTGRPIANAIVWQDQRTAEMCVRIADQGLSDEIWSRTGLTLDPYFSATKMKWLLANLSEPNLMRRAEAGELRFGTVDSWLIDSLTRASDGSMRADDVPHLTDVTNASRTLLLNIHDLVWDADLLDIFCVPEAALARPLPSSGPFAHTHPSVLGAEVPIAAVAGDQHAAFYGQTCFKRGEMKCTYGTGAFILANAGTDSGELFSGASPARSSPSDNPSQVVGDTDSGLLFTPAWQVGGSRVYALEGSIFTTGATVQWLRDRLGVIGDADETSDLAVLAGENQGIYFVPAFAGLGTPHWDPHARASITGISGGSGREHIVRAALESTAYQVKDVIDLIDNRLRSWRGSKSRSRTMPLRVDGGQTRNPFLMQFQADILDRPVEVSAVDETTALGIAFIAGRSIGLWRSERELSELWKASARYEPQMGEGERVRLMAGWREAIRRTKTKYEF